MDEWNRIRSVIPSMDALAVTLVDDPTDGVDLPAGERQVLAQVDDRSTLAEIRERCHATDFFVCRVLYEAVQASKVKVIPSPWEGREADEAGAAQSGAAQSGTASGGGGKGGAPGEITSRLLLDAAQPFFEQRKFEDALRHLRAARALEPHNREVKEAVEAAEAEVRTTLQEAGVKPSAVPRLTKSLEELTTSQLTRNEGFVLSRVNGSYDIASIVKISSLPELDALVAFFRLAEAGHLVLE
jgi:hypothetical protein